MDANRLPPLTRRQFLRRLGIATGTVLGTSLIDDLRAVAKPERPLEVVIAGAGMAGLVAAYELEQLGHKVVLLEAEEKHAGGRVRTLRFDGGLYGEAGAMRIPLGHKLTREYARRFDLPLRKFVQFNPEGFFYLRGRRERIRDVEKIKEVFALKEEEKKKSPGDLWDEAVVARLKALSAKERADLSSESLETEVVRGLDQLSLRQLCERAGQSEEAMELLAVTAGFETILTSAATEHLREERDQVWTQEFHEIVGGMDRLPAAFVARLKSKPRMGCEVIALGQDNVKKRAWAVYTEGGEEKRVEGDFLLCTLPLPILSRLKVEPLFSGPKAGAIRQLGYDSATKVLAVCARRFWEADEGIFGGGTFTDLPTGTTYYPADNAEAKDAKVSAGPGVMLASYTWGQTARRLATFLHEDCCTLVKQQMAKVHPQFGKKGVVSRLASWNWDSHAWSGGAFALFMPGQHTSLHRHLVAPEGRIYFAGEHASLAHSWIQGALESGLRATREMLQAARA